MTTRFTLEEWRAFDDWVEGGVVPDIDGLGVFQAAPNVTATPPDGVATMQALSPDGSMKFVAWKRSPA